MFLGAIDPARLANNTVEEREAVFFLDTFQPFEDKFEFVCFFIEKHLTPAFRSTQSTLIQGHLSYAIQELLKVSVILYLYLVLWIYTRCHQSNISGCQG